MEESEDYKKLLNENGKLDFYKLEQFIADVYYKESNPKQLANNEQYIKELAFVETYKNNLDNLPNKAYNFGGLITGKGGAITMYEIFIKEQEKWNQ